MSKLAGAIAKAQPDSGRVTWSRSINVNKLFALPVPSQWGLPWTWISCQPSPFFPSTASSSSALVLATDSSRCRHLVSRRAECSRRQRRHHHIFFTLYGGFLGLLFHLILPIKAGNFRGSFRKITWLSPTLCFRLLIKQQPANLWDWFPLDLGLSFVIVHHGKCRIQSV